ncbi:hypothetical protein H2200_013143 [Cladophialophora chaetospira]|uniref:N-acetyltransferase domain-containing protein n=1 Tax=Cladophialophora chaetospira TaxID=386627 RepID=A0AA38WW86_9EURO|nr:hypothetical protein H2200_013143 [Cladophialophora chaetospira]
MEGSAIAVTNISVTSLVNGEHDSSRLRKQPVPPITTSQSDEYCHRLADISSRATVTDPLNIVFQQEKTGPSKPVTADMIYIGSKRRIETKVAAGALIVEACNFAAIACWEPPSSNPPPLTEAQYQEIAAERPVFAQFVRDIQNAQDACLGVPAPRHWKLSLMARDPERKDKGAVRAVIEPFVARAKKERVPLWLVAGNPRARDVYAYFGFRVVQVIWSFPKDGPWKESSVPTWCMVCNWPLE